MFFFGCAIFSPVEPPSPIDSSLEQLVRHGHHLRRPLDCYSPSAFIATTLSEPAYYRDAISSSGMAPHDGRGDCCS
jgi:hypothetical protein